MLFPYQSSLFLGPVALNVLNLEKMTAFYTKLIGLQVISSDENQVALGSNAQDIQMILQKTTIPSEQSYGLYHTAILVPNRPALGLALSHLLANQIPLEGGADHGYSEAIYLSDPEGNGVEIYRDKPESEWDIREDGRIIGVTEELEAQSLVEYVNQLPDHYRLDKDTIIGHVHLSVPNAAEASELYQKVFGMTEKFGVPSASWISSGQYHHHLAFNQWAGGHLNKRQEGEQGLAYLTIQYGELIDFKASLKKAKLYGMTVLSESSDRYLVEDQYGIRVNVEIHND